MMRFHPLLLAALLAGVIFVLPASARPKQRHMTPEFYRQNCLLCHKTAVPEGLAPWIVAGVKPAHPTNPRDVMPNVVCWRNCERCWNMPDKPRR